MAVAENARNAFVGVSNPQDNINTNLDGLRQHIATVESRVAASSVQQQQQQSLQITVNEAQNPDTKLTQAHTAIEKVLSDADAAYKQMREVIQAGLCDHVELKDIVG